jgi:hypothetical protein
MQPVAVQRIALATQEGDPPRRDRIEQRLNASMERSLLDARPVVELALRRIAAHRLAAELLSEEEIAEAVLLKQARKPLLAKVRDETRIGPRRTSATTSTACPRRSARKYSIEWFECPTVNSGWRGGGLIPVAPSWTAP